MRERGRKLKTEKVNKIISMYKCKQLSGFKLKIFVYLFFHNCDYNFTSNWQTSHQINISLLPKFILYKPIFREKNKHKYICKQIKV